MASPSVAVRPIKDRRELEKAWNLIGSYFTSFNAGEITVADRRFESVSKNFSRDRSLMLVALEGESIVGGAFAFGEDQDNVTLRMIGLDPTFRGYGLGRQLVEKIELAARDLGATRISLGADEASGFYLRLGYSKVDHNGLAVFTKKLT